MKFSIVTSLFFLLLSHGPTPSAATLTVVINLCEFPIYAKTTRGDAYDSGDKTKIHPNGDFYVAPIEPLVNSAEGGLCVKLQHDEDGDFNTNVYQIEVSETDSAMGADGDGSGGHLWYDLSTVDGIPWPDQWRRLELAGPRRCPVLECPPGKHHCEWPEPEATGAMGDCDSGGQGLILFTLCRGTGIIGLDR